MDRRAKGSSAFARPRKEPVTSRCGIRGAWRRTFETFNRDAGTPGGRAISVRGDRNRIRERCGHRSDIPPLQPELR